MLSSATKKKIDTARDILVGKIPMPTSQVEQITLALIYKFMSDMDKKTKDLGDTSGFFANGYEKYAWDNLMDKALPARDRVLLYRDALEKMALNSHIPQLFRDIFRNASLPFNDPETLKLFLDVIDQFEYDHSEELGNAFEYLLQIMGSQGDAGQFRTPRHIIDFIVEVVDPQKTDTVLDPACGTAGFLISAYKHLRKNGLTNDDMDQVSKNFVGYDISQDMQRLSLVNMYLHHFPDPHIYEYDSLSSEDRWNDDFDVILANPPFMTPKGGIRPHNRFSVPSNRAEVLFVDYIMEHLTINGKAGVIVPEGIIFQSQNAYKALRKMMVDNDYLWAVVSLPSGIFQPYSGVKTSVLLFDRQLAKKTNKILFVKVENDGFDLGAQRRASKKNDLPDVVSILQKYKRGLIEGKNVDFQESEMVNVIDKKAIRDGGYNLSGSKYDIEKVINHSGYKVVAIKEVATIQKGSAITQKTSKSGEIPVIAGGMSFSYTHNISNRNPNVITVSASGANAGYIWFHDYPIFASDCTTIEADPNLVNSKYLYSMLKSKQDYFYSLQKGGAQPHVYGKDFEDFEIPLPPLSVQQEIVEELDRYQKIIDGSKQVVDNYQPSFKIEDDWETAKLSAVCNLTTGTTPSTAKSEYYEGKNPFVKTGEIDNCIITEAKTHISDEAISDYNLKVFSPNTILMAMYGQGKTRGKVALLKTRASTTQNAAAIQVTDESKLRPEFLYYYFLGQYENLRKAGIQGHISHLNIKLLSSIEVPIPPIEVQESIIEQLDSEAKWVHGSMSLSQSFEKKIADRVNGIWGK